MSVPQIVVVGSVNTDMVVQGPRLPGPGETVIGGRFVMAAGGKGANQAVAAARLGAEVSLVARVGTDWFGEQALQGYRREGVGTDLIVRDPQAHTGVALILVDVGGENSISVASGANANLTPADVERASERIAGAAVLLLQLEVPLEAVCRAARLAAEAGVPVILDPAPAAPLPRDLLECVDLLTPNEHEAQFLTGIAVRDEGSARAAAARLLADGAKNVAITLGPRGVLLATPDAARLIPSVRIDAIDTTAAGDAFNAGLAWGLAAGLPLEQAASRACLVGALCATRLGAQPSLPTAAQFEEFLGKVG
jgi:ribokinase